MSYTEKPDSCFCPGPSGFLELQITGRESGWTAGQLLRKRLGFSKKQISRLKFRESGILVNGERQRVNVLLKEGDILKVGLAEGSRSGKVEPCPGQGILRILYEDRDLLAVDKPAGLVCHPSHGHHLDTLANQAAAYLRGGGEACTIRICGRLDKDTSGIVLFAKNREAAAALARQRAAGVMRKVYLAMTEGCPEPREGTVDAPVGRAPGELMKMQVSEEGKPARTGYRVLRTEEWRGRQAALVELTLEQGRTHQIRVHMAALGCPLAGDPLYGNPAGSGARLHAWKLSLVQPFTGERIFFRAESPDWAGL